MNRQNRGFTLVELLVVIGIIALLISILLPALNRSRENAKLVACASQMRQVALAARTYAVENKGYLPPFANDNGPNYHIYEKWNATATFASSRGGGTCIFARTIFWPYYRNGRISAAMASDPKNSTIGAGIGRLVNAKYLQGDFYRMMTCPSVYQGEGAGIVGDTAGIGWGNATYGFNPHLAFRYAPGSTTLLTQPWWRKLNTYGRAKGTFKAMQMSGSYPIVDHEFGGRRFALVTDPINYPSVVNPGLGAPTHQSKNNYAVNLCFSDGSVQTAYLSKNVNRAGGTIGRFVDLLSYLEMSLEGGGMGAQYKPLKYAYVPVNP